MKKSQDRNPSSNMVARSKPTAASLCDSLPQTIRDAVNIVRSPHDSGLEIKVSVPPSSWSRLARPQQTECAGDLATWLRNHGKMGTIEITAAASTETADAIAEVIKAGKDWRYLEITDEGMDDTALTCVAKAIRTRGSGPPPTLSLAGVWTPKASEIVRAGLLRAESISMPASALAGWAPQQTSRTPFVAKRLKVRDTHQSTDVNGVSELVKQCPRLESLEVLGSDMSAKMVIESALSKGINGPVVTENLSRAFDTGGPSAPHHWSMSSAHELPIEYLNAQSWGADMLHGQSSNDTLTRATRTPRPSPTFDRAAASDASDTGTGTPSTAARAPKVRFAV